MNALINLPVEYQYLIAISFILLLPKILLRFRIPTGITSLFIGVICINFLGWFQDDQLIVTLATLGITSLFLFAGMEIEIEDLKENAMPLTKHIVKSVVLMIVVGLAFQYVLNLSFQIGLIISVAIFTPSAGFILSSLKSYELTDKEVYWVKLKAISQEIAAIVVLFVALQLNDLTSLFRTQAIFIAIAFILPFIFKFFLKIIAPYAPKSEVSFLVIIAFIMGVLTKKLGTHYLVGAFIAGFVAGQFNHFMKSDESDRIISSLSAFFYIFVPFYFFKAGLIVTKDLITVNGIYLGLAFIAIFLPIRIYSVILSLKYFIKDFWEDRMKISMSLTPNLIFGLVIVGILKDTFNVDSYILTGLIVYTLVSSLLPAIFFEKTAPESYDLSRGGPGKSH